MTKRDRLIVRNSRITSRFLELKNKKYKGRVQEFSDEKIFLMLEEEFHLSQSYIEKIVFNRVKYKSAV